VKTGESENPHGDKGFSQFPQSFPHFPVETVVAGGGSVEKSAGKNGQKRIFLQVLEKNTPKWISLPPLAEKHGLFALLVRIFI